MSTTRMNGEATVDSPGHSELNAPSSDKRRWLGGQDYASSSGVCRDQEDDTQRRSTREPCPVSVQTKAGSFTLEAQRATVRRIQTQPRGYLI
ncbi:hypothetical protein OH77DRAFT_255795 [Trametes cingulata]|nr:hypothetical protein OH77DRAFT_255795 [Trametes cingulata]